MPSSARFVEQQKRITRGLNSCYPLIFNRLAEREGIGPTKDKLPFNGFEDRGDHQAHSTLRTELGREWVRRQINEVRNLMKPC